MEWPNKGEQFTDAEGRELVVAEVVPGDSDGREIRGYVAPSGESWGGGVAYATDANIFDAVWRRRVPRWRGKG